MAKVTVKVVPWTWRDGTVHFEVRCVTFPDEVNGDLVTHVCNSADRFRTICGVSWFGALSSEGLGNMARVDCESCRKVVQSMTFDCTFDNVNVQPTQTSSTQRSQEES